MATIFHERYDEDGLYYDISIPSYGIDLKQVRCNLVGAHQVGNTALAVLVCAVLSKIYGFKLDRK